MTDLVSTGIRSLRVYDLSLKLWLKLDRISATRLLDFFILLLTLRRRLGRALPFALKGRRSSASWAQGRQLSYTRVGRSERSVAICRGHAFSGPTVLSRTLSQLALPSLRSGLHAFLK